jgi:hypothetical protein
MCGAPVSIIVKDPTTEWDLRLYSVVKEASLGKKNGLLPLFYEEWLLDYEEGTCSVPQAIIFYSILPYSIPF